MCCGCLLRYIEDKDDETYRDQHIQCSFRVDPAKVLSMLVALAAFVGS